MARPLLAGAPRRHRRGVRRAPAPQRRQVRYQAAAGADRGHRAERDQEDREGDAGRPGARPERTGQDGAAGLPLSPADLRRRGAVASPREGRVPLERRRPGAHPSGVHLVRQARGQVPGRRGRHAPVRDPEGAHLAGGAGRGHWVAGGAGGAAGASRAERHERQRVQDPHGQEPRGHLDAKGVPADRLPGHARERGRRPPARVPLGGECAGGGGLLGAGAGGPARAPPLGRPPGEASSASGEAPLGRVGAASLRRPRRGGEVAESAPARLLGGCQAGRYSRDHRPRDFCG
mmetsp:Transcript_36875/g.98791  ORF Transcript_36875/g.98791 Transcript_36875/m.98791 type:complete len:290 (+) Transcript_36875:478-1347(+)